MNIFPIAYTSRRQEIDCSKCLCLSDLSNWSGCSRVSSGCQKSNKENVVISLLLSRSGRLRHIHFFLSGMLRDWLEFFLKIVYCKTEPSGRNAVTKTFFFCHFKLSARVCIYMVTYSHNTRLKPLLYAPFKSRIIISVIISLLHVSSAFVFLS